MEKKSLSGWQIFWIIFGGLLVLGMFTGGATSGNKSTGGGSTYTPTKSAWCQQHEDDEWSGEVDSVTRRYFAECV